MKTAASSALLVSALFCSVASGQSLPGQSSSSASPDIILHEGASVTLPDAPEPRPDRVGFWSVGDPWGDKPLRTNREVFHDKALFAAQTFWLGAIVYDSELTHQGLAHHKCVEGNLELVPHPSRGAIYRSDLPEYAVGTAANWLVLRFVAKPIIFEFPTYGSIMHIRAGSGWLLSCW